MRVHFSNLVVFLPLSLSIADFDKLSIAHQGFTFFTISYIYILVP